MSETVEIVVDDQGRIVLPAAVLRRLGLTAGATLVVEQETDDEVVFRVEPSEPVLVDRDGILVAQSAPLANIADVVQHHRALRLAKLALPDE